MPHIAILILSYAQNQTVTEAHLLKTLERIKKSHFSINSGMEQLLAEFNLPQTAPSTQLLVEVERLRLLFILAGNCVTFSMYRFMKEA
jgi:hypothetical protein